MSGATWSSTSPPGPGAELLLGTRARLRSRRAAADPQTVGQIMLFRVVPLTTPDASVLPQTLTTLTRLSNPSVTRVMTLNEMMGSGGPLGALLNGMEFHAGVTEYPELGSTEMWEVSHTGDSHPIHIHLATLALTSDDHAALEHAYGGHPEMPADTYNPVAVEAYLKGKPVPADANERGWKDTFRMNPGEVTRILVRFAPQDETPAYAFDATAEPGYVWHCHILEHEENDMMRPYYLRAGAVQAGVIADGGSEPAGARGGHAASGSPAQPGGHRLRTSASVSGSGERGAGSVGVTGQHISSLPPDWHEGRGPHGGVAAPGGTPPRAASTSSGSGETVCRPEPETRPGSMIRKLEQGRPRARRGSFSLSRRSPPSSPCPPARSRNSRHHQRPLGRQWIWLWGGMGGFRRRRRRRPYVVNDGPNS